jgi:hypothetical protein
MKLKKFADQVKDAEIETRNAELESSVDHILAFVRAGGARAFSFVFIDPTGWSGFSMDTIAPLLRLAPGEVLINFMTEHIRRFIDSPVSETQESFEGLFGSADFRSQLKGLTGHDRIDALVETYMANVKKTGKYSFVCPAIILHPEEDRAPFHLIYATRNPRGVEVFKEAEKRAMAVMEKARADAQQRNRERKTKARDLFHSEVCFQSTIYPELRERYLNKARSEVAQMLKEKRRVLYDVIWSKALTNPLVWASDLKNWIKEWQAGSHLRLEGLTEGERVPKLDHHHYLVWQQS